MLENNIDLCAKLNHYFKDITYKDSIHTYYKGDKSKMVSVTQFLSSIKNKFDREYWSVYKSYEFSGLSPKYNWRDNQNRVITLEDGTLINLTDDHSTNSVTPEMVLDQWSIDNVTGTTRGSYIHDYLEARESRLLDLPKIPFINQLNTIQTVKFYQSLNVGKELADKYLESIRDYLTPVAMEFVVGSVKLNIAGRFDRLYWNSRDQEYQIWDFKTDKKINYSSKDKVKIFNLSDCEYTKYSLQTSFYKYIIESETGEQLGSSYIVHFDIKNNDWNIIKCSDYTNLIKEKANEISWSTLI